MPRTPRTVPTPELESVASAELERLCRTFPMRAKPILLWKPYRVTAGMAYYKKNTIGLSVHVLKTPEAVVETLGHEYAHLLAVHRHGVRAANHGPFWQKAMLDLGLEPKVRHRYEVERNVPRQTVTYSCVSCGKEFERSRRLPKNRKYVHANCGGALRLRSVSPAKPKSKN